jgi:hypothetical protein
LSCDQKGTHLAFGAGASPRFEEIPMNNHDCTDTDALPCGRERTAEEV